MQEKIKILYVDDEANNLIGFKASFRNSYQIYTALSAEEGFTVLQKHPDIQIIMCDHRMPAQTGVDFFENVAEKFPKPVRMLLTAYADVNAIIGAINRGHVYRYITKPWTEPDIRSAVEEGYKYYITTSKLNEKDEQLEKAYQELDKFAYSVTHDVRGPIISLLSALNAISESKDLDEIYYLVSMMVQTVEGLDTFVRNMHASYSLKQGELIITEISFPDAVRNLYQTYLTKAEKQGIDFQMTISQQGDFRSDEKLLHLILNNLLSNAFKFQKEEAATKFVNLRINVQKGLATVIVADNGIGIKEIYHKDIYNMFFRATAYNAGAGIGLYNVKDAPKKLGGEIYMTSAYGEGTEFRLVIPSK